MPSVATVTVAGSMSLRPDPGQLLGHYAFELDAVQLVEQALGDHQRGGPPAAAADGRVEARLLAYPHVGMAGANRRAQGVDQVEQAGVAARVGRSAAQRPAGQRFGRPPHDGPHRQGADHKSDDAGRPAEAPPEQEPDGHAQRDGGDGYQGHRPPAVGCGPGSERVGWHCRDDLI